MTSWLAEYPASYRAKARALLANVLAYYEDPNHWTKEAFYRDGAGEVCAAEKASCACLVGATNLVKFPGGNETDATYINSLTVPQLARVALSIANDRDGIMDFNDAPERTIEEVRQFIQKGIDYLDTLAVSHP